MQVRWGAVSITGNFRENNEDRCLTDADGRYFFVISHYGDVENDSNTYELQLWETSEVLGALSRHSDVTASALHTVTFRSSTSAPAISQAAFDESGTAIVFRAPDAQGIVNVYRLEIASGQLEQLTHHAEDVIRFVYRNGTVLFSSYAGIAKDPAPMRSPP